MHSLEIAHRDLKLDNVFIGIDYKLKVADMGFCKLYSEGSILDTKLGTPCYMAPELFTGE